MGRFTIVNTVESAELELLLGDLESDRVERKAALSEPDRVREAICAFANDLPGHGKPGVVFVGASDDGSPAGLAITDELLLKLSNMRDDGAILPIPSMVVEKRMLAGAEMVVVVVHPAAFPPVRFRGRTWVRVGPRRAVASAEDERRLAERRRSGDLPFELRPVSDASLADLDLDLFRRTYLPSAVAPDVLAANSRTDVDQLRSLRFVTAGGMPTGLGVLVLGRDGRRFLPGAYVQFVRFDGTALTDPIRDEKSVAGPLTESLRELDLILEAHNAVGVSITTGPMETRSPEYPIAALQQLTRNALLHRTYEVTNAPVRVFWFSDRIEIHSPGGPFGLVTRENFGQPGVTDYRNAHLAEAMRVLGYVQRFGVGLQIARSELERNGNPPPEFKVEDRFVLVTVRRKT
jgi:ATP-dependent DNA helicase RecG